ncbi:hypothetical protein CN585_23180 [Bacillus toyonensis]|uniref:Uncharacterized protein n=1 Tax=Bacillus toyonensis TaxID=155322 RepID=A0A2A8HAM9_9BACI|nr:hypothetical protein CN585_23180 [Bacillus toyonensis]
MYNPIFGDIYQKMGGRVFFLFGMKQRIYYEMFVESIKKNSNRKEFVQKECFIKIFLRFVYFLIVCGMRNRLFLKKLDSIFSVFFCTHDFIRLCLASHSKWEQKFLMFFSFFVGTV